MESYKQGKYEITKKDLQPDCPVDVYDTEYPLELGGPRKWLATFSNGIDAHNYTAWHLEHDKKFDEARRATSERYAEAFKKMPTD